MESLEAPGLQKNLIRRSPPLLIVVVGNQVSADRGGECYVFPGKWRKTGRFRTPFRYALSQGSGRRGSSF